MKSSWSLAILPAVALGLNCQTQASTHCTVSIIMTTLGTDGTTVVHTDPVPSGAVVKEDPNLGSVPSTNPTAASNKPGLANANNGAGSSGGSTSQVAPSAPANLPTGASGNPTPETNVPPDTDDTSVPVPTDNNPSEPLPPAPPVLPPTEPPVPPTDVTPIPPDTIPVPTDGIPDTPETAEAPEPGTLTLLGLATVGGIGYARRKRNPK